MKALRVVLPLVVAGIIVLVALSQLNARAAADAFRVERAALRREMVERSAVARGLGTAAGVEEARAALSWWFDSMAALRHRFPRPARDADADRPASGTGGDAGDAGAGRRYGAERLAALRAGYAPVLSGADQGLRLDLLAVTPGQHPDTHERALRIDFALWGAPRRIDRDASGEGARTPPRVVVPLSFRQIAFRFVTGSGKTYGEMTGSGEPHLLLKDPERFTSDLPPGLALGTWWVDPFPREAARVEIAIAVQVQGMSAAALGPSFRWELDVPEGWKLRPGETYRAEPREAPPEPAAPR